MGLTSVTRLGDYGQLGAVTFVRPINAVHLSVAYLVLAETDLRAVAFERARGSTC